MAHRLTGGEGRLPEDTPTAREARMLRTLERLVNIRALGVRPALDEASTLIADALRADKVDVFVLRPEGPALVALGTSATPMGARQREVGLDRLPVAGGGRAVGCFQSGEPFLTGATDRDPDEVPGIKEELGVRSSLLVPLVVGGDRRGVLSVVSARPDFFDRGDRRFAEAVAGWVGLVLYRAELFDQAVDDAFKRGRRAAAQQILTRLSAREQEVALLVAAGLTNAEIAERLVLTPGTVANHVRRILAKLALATRTQLAVWAVERGLYQSRPADGAAQPTS